ncbi:MAG: Fic family protein [Bdellovibrionota bacterium]
MEPVTRIFQDPETSVSVEKFIKPFFDPGILTPEHKTCIAHALNQLGQVPQTFNGIDDSRFTSGKPELLLQGTELANQLKRNFVRAIIYLFQSDESLLKGAVKAVMPCIIKCINDQLVQAGTENDLRTESTGVSIHKIVNNVPFALCKFFDHFGPRAFRSKQDPVEFAAWIEHEFNGRIHPLANGSGRTSRALATWALARNGLLLPNYSSREIFFEKLASPFPVWLDFYRKNQAEAQASASF